MRDIKQILENKNKEKNINNRIDYQKLFESKKIQEETLLPQGIWVDENKPIGWEEIEAKAWHFITNIGVDFKLLTLWAESYLNLNSIKGVSFVFDLLLNVLKDDQELLPKDEDEAFSLVKYLDKSLHKVLCEINLSFDRNHLINLMQFENFHLENFNQFKENISYITDLNYEKLEQEVEEIKKSFADLSNFLSDNKLELPKTKNIISQLKNFLVYCKEMKKIDMKDDFIEEEKQSISYLPQDAYQKIDEAVEILEQIDANNLVLPLLKKALKWKDLNVLDILSDIGSAQEIEAFIKMLGSEKEN